MAFWTYMLRCSDGRYYTGHTDNLDHRIGQHQSGQGSDFTRRRLPVIVGVWARAKKEALIAGNWPLVSYFAKPPRERFSTSLETNRSGKGAQCP